MKAAEADLHVLTEPDEATAMLHPLRAQVLGRARTPCSASEIAGELGLPRQRVNYHVRELARAGLLRKAGRVRKRNMYEQRYVATARSYALSPSLLGSLGVDMRELTDRFSAEYLIGLATRLQGEVEIARREAGRTGKRLPTLSIDCELRFENAAQRTAFTDALQDAVTRVVAEHASPADGAGRPYRLVLGCHPIPKSDEAAAGAAGGETT